MSEEAPPEATTPDDSLGAAAEPELLTQPADGIPRPITDSAELAGVVATLGAASGPVAIDAERASGYRYSQRAYLVQLRRAGASTVLIDPTALPALTTLNRALGDAEWILHAASQDLACLAELGLHPMALFDTELAGRLLGEERVGLGTMIELRLGVRLAKEHAAADWSTRPLPQEWLAYAALDVELLIPLRAVLADELAAAGKTEWARQEFEHVRTHDHVVVRAEPWRRTSGVHRARGRRQLAIVRALSQARDRYAAERDIAPGRLLPDSAIVEAARAEPTSAAALGQLPVFRGPRQRRQLNRWWAAVDAARNLPSTELPPLTGSGGDGIPPAGRWRDRDPVAADRLTRCRAVVAEIAEEHAVLAQNLLASEAVRALAWSPPAATAEAVATALAASQARPWQIGLCAERLAAVLPDDSD